MTATGAAHATAPLKLLIIAGARPNFMKVAPIIKAAQAHNQRAKNGERQIQCRLVHTGQHYDAKMSDIFFQELGIPAPDVNLEVGSGSHAAQTANIMLRFEPVLEKERPNWLVVVGDVNSTMACTLVASKMAIKVAHVEAGLRSGDRTMPEEINRLVTDSIADLLLTPSADADENLRREGIPEAKIKLVGNIMIDSLVANIEKARSVSILKSHALTKGRFAYVTLHRPANVDHKDNLNAIMVALLDLSRQIPVVFPMHPRTRKMLAEHRIDLSDSPNLLIIDPIGYHESICLTENAKVVVTDSGGLQEESTFFQTPCLTLRPNTERPVTITIGSNRLTTPERLGNELKELNGNHHRGSVPPLWDGRAAERVLAHLLQF